MGYLGIKRYLDKVKVNYPRVSIFQAYELKEALEELKIKIDRVKIASVEATIRKSLRLFARNFSQQQEEHQPIPGTHPLRNEFYPHLF